MADTLFTAGTIVASAWLNDVDKSVYSVLSAVAGTNTITANGPLPVTSYTRGLRFFFTPSGTNTGPVTLNVNGLGPKNVTRQGSVPLGAGEIVQSSTVVVFYDGAQFQLLAPYQGPLLGIDTYVTTAGTTTAYTITFPDQFSLVSGRAVKVLFNAANTSTTPTLNVNGTGVFAIKVLDFTGNKIDPIVGAFGANVSATARYDGTNWIVAVEYPSGRLINTQTFTASATYTPTPGTTRVIVEMVGGGAQGGGSALTAAAQVAVGAGGGAGGYTKSLHISPGIQSVTIGNGGFGAAAGAAGTNGSATSFGVLSTALGGAGGQAGAAGGVSAVNGGAGGGAGTSNIIGNSGSSGGSIVSTFASGIAISGSGALGPLGGGNASAALTGGGSVNGNAATVPSYGAGGSGSASLNGGAAATGGVGRNGICIVYEYS